MELTSAEAVLTEADDASDVLETLGNDARARIHTVREGLRVMLDALSRQPGSVAMAPVRTRGRAADARGERRSASMSPADDEYELRPPTSKAAAPKARAIAARGKTARVASKPERRTTKTSTKRKRASA